MPRDGSENAALAPAEESSGIAPVPALFIKPPTVPLTPDALVDPPTHPHSAPDPATPMFRANAPSTLPTSGSITGASPQTRKVKHMKHRSLDTEPVDLQPLQPSELAAALATEPFVVIVDVRPFATYVYMRLRDAISICIPSTLLKRPTFGFNRIIDFVAPQDAERLQRVSEASRVVFYDQSTASLSALHNTPLARTAAKILGAERMEMTNKLYFIVGGISAVAQSHPELVQTDDSLPVQISEEEDAPKLSLGNVRASPRSPFTLLPVVTTAVRSALGSPVSTLSPKMPPLDDSSRLETWPEVNGHMDTLPKWLTEAIQRSGSGQNVLAEAFQQLQAAETSRVRGSQNRDRLSARLLSPHRPASSRSPKSPVYMSPNSTMSSAYSAASSVETSPAGTSNPSQTQYMLVAGDDPSKNRYTNIAPFNYNRVVARGHYLNASFIQSHDSPLRYIATQAPVPASFSDFWWCVWEQRVPVIVMLTVLTTESGQIKGHRYWSSGLYDGLQVECRSETPVSESSQTGIVVRQFVLRNGDEQRIVSQLQYERWPDLGCPANPNEVLRLVEVKSSLLSQTGSLSDPVIVHCSAGCGRTGTFCTIDTVTDYLWRLGPAAAQKDTVDRVFSTVSEFREQRIAMVQNQKQLLLCYQSVILWAVKNFSQYENGTIGHDNNHDNNHEIPDKVQDKALTVFE